MQISTKDFWFLNNNILSSLFLKYLFLFSKITGITLHA